MSSSDRGTSSSVQYVSITPVEGSAGAFPLLEVPATMSVEAGVVPPSKDPVSLPGEAIVTSKLQVVCVCCKPVK
jgi:hypothetical protein